MTPLDKKSSLHWSSTTSYDKLFCFDLKNHTLCYRFHQNSLSLGNYFWACLTVYFPEFTLLETLQIIILLPIIHFNENFPTQIRFKEVQIN